MPTTHSILHQFTTTRCDSVAIFKGHAGWLRMAPQVLITRPWPKIHSPTCESTPELHRMPGG